jgi:hypothetical protein
MAKAFQASKLSSSMAIDVFAKALADRGYKPVCLFASGGARPPLYRLALPEAGAGVGRMT